MLAEARTTSLPTPALATPGLTTGISEPRLNTCSSDSHGQRSGEPSAYAALIARKMSRTITSVGPGEEGKVEAWVRLGLCEGSVGPRMECKGYGSGAQCYM